MTGEGIKIHATVVMDNTKKGIVTVLRKYIDSITNAKYGKSICLPLDASLPSMTVIGTVTDQWTYAKIQREVEEWFPGLCVYDPPM